MISAGAIVGGPEAVFFDSVLREFMQRCEHQGTWTESNIHVNIVYHLPGSTWSPDYIGVRDAKFSRKARTLMVQIAVEDEWIRGRDRVVVEDSILDAADEAICVAKTRFDRAGIEYDLESDRQFLNRCRDQTTKANKP